jgi:hypothetical protein
LAGHKDAEFERLKPYVPGAEIVAVDGIGKANKTEAAVTATAATAPAAAGHLPNTVHVITGLSPAAGQRREEGST